jgi:hypothetical protein
MIAAAIAITRNLDLKADCTMNLIIGTLLALPF